MILGLRATRSQIFTGINVFRSFDWTMPIDELGQQCFRTFDDVMAKLNTDPDSTRIAVPGLKANDPLTKLNTANLAAVRSVPERFRKCVWLWTLAVIGDAGERAVWSQLPSWCRLTLESDNGDLELLQSKASGSQWSTTALSPQHRRLHFAFGETPQVFSLNRSPLEDLRFFKVSELLRPGHRLANALSLKLDQGRDEAPELRRFEE